MQLTIADNFISSIDNDEEHVMHSKSDNIESMINDDVDEVIKELFDLLKNRYQNKVSNKVNESEFVFDYGQLLYHKYHKINLTHGGSYIDSPNWIKPKSNNKSYQQI